MKIVFIHYCQYPFNFPNHAISEYCFPIWGTSPFNTKSLWFRSEEIHSFHWRPSTLGTLLSIPKRLQFETWLKDISFGSELKNSQRAQWTMSSKNSRRFIVSLGIVQNRSSVFLYPEHLEYGICFMFSPIHPVDSPLNQLLIKWLYYYYYNFYFWISLWVE